MDQAMTAFPNTEIAYRKFLQVSETTTAKLF